MFDSFVSTTFAIKYCTAAKLAIASKYVHADHDGKIRLKTELISKMSKTKPIMRPIVAIPAASQIKTNNSFSSILRELSICIFLVSLSWILPARAHMF